MGEPLAISQQRSRHQQSIIIEEEPSHEFYASLFRKKASIQPVREENAKIARHESDSSSCCSLLNYMPHSTRIRTRTRTAADIHVVSFEEPSVEKASAEFAKVYKRALSDPPKLSSLALDQNNRGYQMLENMGWNEEEGGLGRQRQGKMMPAKTVLKSNKLGLGAGKRKEARITHLPTKNVHEERNNAPLETKSLRKRRRKLEEGQEAFRAKRAHMLLRTDVSDEYEQLYMKLHSG